MTVTADASDEDADVAFLDDGGNALDDADEDDTNGQQVDLVVGETVIVVRVTAEDGVSMQDYTVTVTRAQYACEAPDLTGRHSVWTADMTVGVLDEGLGYEWFPNTGTLSDRIVPVGEAPIGQTTNTISRLYYNLARGFLNFETGGAIPPADQVGLSLHICGDTFDLTDAQTDFNEDWFWYDAGNFNWSTGITVSVALSYRLSTNAWLSGLELEGNAGGAVALSPAFFILDTAYTASVVNAVSRVTVRPAPQQGNATVAYFDGEGNALDDADGDDTNGQQVDLAEGENVIAVRVTASDGVTDADLHGDGDARGADERRRVACRTRAGPGRVQPRVRPPSS